MAGNSSTSPQLPRALQQPWGRWLGTSLGWGGGREAEKPRIKPSALRIFFFFFNKSVVFFLNECHKMLLGGLVGATSTCVLGVWGVWGVGVWGFGGDLGLWGLTGGPRPPHGGARPLRGGRGRCGAGGRAMAAAGSGPRAGGRERGRAAAGRRWAAGGSGGRARGPGPLLLLLRDPRGWRQHGGAERGPAAASPGVGKGDVAGGEGGREGGCGAFLGFPTPNFQPQGAEVGGGAGRGVFGGVLVWLGDGTEKG